MGRKSARVHLSQENTLAKAAILEESRDCAYTRYPRPLADMQPASQAGCLFVGFDNSVNGGGAERFGPAT
jgi:hypothetical protein